MSTHTDKFARFFRMQCLADRIFDPTSPDACEAAAVIRHFAKLQDRHERSLCTRARRAFGRIVNRFYGVRARKSYG